MNFTKLRVRKTIVDSGYGFKVAGTHIYVLLFAFFKFYNSVINDIHR